ncbi:hypothetical protein ACLOJK_028087 [Asimina triloba]
MRVYIQQNKLELEEVGIMLLQEEALLERHKSQKKKVKKVERVMMLYFHKHVVDLKEEVEHVVEVVAMD